MADAVYDRLVCSGITQAVSMDEWKKLTERIYRLGYTSYSLPNICTQECAMVPTAGTP